MITPMTIAVLEGKCVCGGYLKIEHKTDGEFYVSHTSTPCERSKFEDQRLVDTLRELFTAKNTKNN